MCERVVIIDKGQIQFDDTLKSIQASEPVLVVEVRGPDDAVREVPPGPAGGDGGRGHAGAAV